MSAKPFVQFSQKVWFSQRIVVLRKIMRMQSQIYWSSKKTTQYSNAFRTWSCNAIMTRNSSTTDGVLPAGLSLGLNVCMQESHEERLKDRVACADQGQSNNSTEHLTHALSRDVWTNTVLISTRKGHSPYSREIDRAGNLSRGSNKKYMWRFHQRHMQILDHVLR